MRPPSAVRHAPDLDDRWRIRLTRALTAGSWRPWFDRLRLLPLPRCGLQLCSRRYLLGARLGSARGSATRRRSFAAREPVKLQLSGFLACNRAEVLVGHRAMSNFRNCAMME